MNQVLQYHCSRGNVLLIGDTAKGELGQVRPLHLLAEVVQQIFYRWANAYRLVEQYTASTNANWTAQLLGYLSIEAFAIGEIFHKYEGCLLHDYPEAGKSFAEKRVLDALNVILPAREAVYCEMAELRNMLYGHTELTLIPTSKKKNISRPINSRFKGNNPTAPDLVSVAQGMGKKVYLKKIEAFLNAVPKFSELAQDVCFWVEEPFDGGIHGNEMLLGGNQEQRNLAAKTMLILAGIAEPAVAR